MFRLLAYLFDFIIVAVLWRLISWVLRSIFGTAPGGPHRAGNAARRANEPITSGQTARDPMCGMFVSTEVSHKLNNGSETLHFCSRECLENYQKKAASA